VREHRRFDTPKKPSRICTPHSDAPVALVLRLALRPAHARTGGPSLGSGGVFPKTVRQAELRPGGRWRSSAAPDGQRITSRQGTRTSSPKKAGQYFGGEGQFRFDERVFPRPTARAQRAAPSTLVYSLLDEFRARMRGSTRHGPRASDGANSAT